MSAAAVVVVMVMTIGQEEVEGRRTGVWCVLALDEGSQLVAEWATPEPSRYHMPGLGKVLRGTPCCNSRRGPVGASDGLQEEHKS